MCGRRACQSRQPLARWRRLAVARDLGASIGCCAEGCDKCLGNEVRGVVYIKIDDIYLAM